MRCKTIHRINALGNITYLIYELISKINGRNAGFLFK